MLGAALFVLHTVMRGGGGDRQPVEISDRFVRGLEAQHERRTGRSPDAEATEALVVDFVREEVLFREARRLGLDRGDPIVRRRLVQKMEFLLEGTVAVEEPGDQDLAQHMDAHPDRYRRPPRVAFRHRFFSPDRRGDAAEGDARATLRALQAGQSPDEGALRGDPFMLGLDVPARPLDRIAGSFGRELASALESLPEGQWAGPVRSAHGFHVVQVTERLPGGIPPLSEVRERVRADWLETQRKQAVRAAVEALVDSYGVRRVQARGQAVPSRAEAQP
jgi:hypothetical protein